VFFVAIESWQRRKPRDTERIATKNTKSLGAVFGRSQTYTDYAQEVWKAGAGS